MKTSPDTIGPDVSRYSRNQPAAERGKLPLKSMLGIAVAAVAITGGFDRDEKSGPVDISKHAREMQRAVYDEKAINTMPVWPVKIGETVDPDTGNVVNSVDAAVRAVNDTAGNLITETQVDALKADVIKEQLGGVSAVDVQQVLQIPIAPKIEAQ